ncbi:MAG TPA: ribosome maturation factor RimP [Egibacteraceae bacterium]
MSDTTSRVRALTEPLAAAAGLDLIAVEVKGAGSRTLVRVVVDRKGGVDLATCQALSRELSEALDAEDPIAGRYTLEVTSPGVDHPLTDQRAFYRVEGRSVLVHRTTGEDRLEQIRGTVVAAEPDAVVLDVDGEEVRVPYAEVAKATQTLPW